MVVTMMMVVVVLVLVMLVIYEGDNARVASGPKQVHLGSVLDHHLSPNLARRHST